jgi:hypothetical protein
MSGKSSFERWSEEARLRDLPDDERPQVDRATVADVRAYLADHLVHEADWRWRVAEKYPEDRWRNNKAATRLSNAADEMRTLSLDDPRLVRLAKLVLEAGGRVPAANRVPRRARLRACGPSTASWPWPKVHRPPGSLASCARPSPRPRRRSRGSASWRFLAS